MDQPQVREQVSSPEDEIRVLEQKLAEKKKELEAKNQPVSPEKEIFREVLKEHIESVRPSASYPAPSGVAPQPSVASGLSPKPTDDDKKKKEEREEIIKQLIEVALSRNIETAVKIAENESPYLLDELHDHLVDDYYDKLVALRKLVTNL